MNISWEQKIVALLHDPPDKQLRRKGHEARGQKLSSYVLGIEIDDKHPLWKRAEWADDVAAAADRGAFSFRPQVPFGKKAILTHMLSGRSVILPNVTQADPQTPERSVRKLIPNPASTSARTNYLRLWRLLLDSVAEDDESGMGTGWRMLPAESRIPDHALLDHLDTTATLSTALPNPALLVFSVGPIQAFIATARRTQDLWMGSYLLSYLTWRGIQAVADVMGPDTILYPNLRGHPLVDLWLNQEGVVVEPPPPHCRQQASLPNTFTALVSADQAQALAERTKQAILTAKQEIADAVRAQFPSPTPNKTWKTIWERQIYGWPEICWSVYLWPEYIAEKSKAAKAIGLTVDQIKTADVAHAWIIRDEYQALISDLPDDDECRKSITDISEDDKWWCAFNKRFELYWSRGPGKIYGAQTLRDGLNSGSMYVLLYDLAKRGLAVRKTVRDFGPAEEDGEKCTVCGERSALRLDDTPRRAVHGYWADVAEALQQQERYTEIRPDGKERLCAICAIKRFVQRSYFKNEIRLKGTFPSTRHIAAAAFWQAVLDSDNSQLWLALTQLSGALYATGIPQTAAENAIPFLWNEAEQISDKVRQKTALNLLCYDAELLTPEAYTDAASFNDEWSVDLKNDDIKQLRALASAVLKAARETGIQPPARYYAALMFDGDHMGKWLSGAMGPKLADVLHPDILNELKTDDEWVEVLKHKRMVSPAHHAAISSALATFSRRIVQMVVEKWHPGRLIYAGGDDVLALLPIADALTVTRELRFLFSGEVKRIGERPNLREVPSKDPDEDKECASGFIELNGEWLTTMGPKASASAGIAIAHYKSPLSDTLAAMRAAEKEAKDENRYGRNALVVHFLKRSGEARHVGTKWNYADKGPTDPVALLTEIQALFAETDPARPHLSGKLPYALHTEARALSGLSCDAIQAEIGRLLKRQGELQDKTRREDLAEKLARWAIALNEYGDGVTMLAEWLVLARFLATGGGEEK